MRPRLVACAALFTLAACSDPQTSFVRPVYEPLPVAPQYARVALRAAVDLSHCGGMGFIPYVGHPVVGPNQPIPREGGYVPWDDLPPDARVLGPGVTGDGDRLPGRLTLVVTGDGLLKRLYCG